MDRRNADCALSFTALRDSDGALALKLRVILKQGEPDALLITTPWGVRLPSGFTLQIDGAQPIAWPFEFCDPTGCHFAAALEPALFVALKRGLQAQAAYAGRDGKSVVLPVSLKGFTAGVGTLSG